MSSPPSPSKYVLHDDDMDVDTVIPGTPDAGYADSHADSAPSTPPAAAAAAEAPSAPKKKKTLSRIVVRRSQIDVRKMWYAGITGFKLFAVDHIKENPGSLASEAKAIWDGMPKDAKSAAFKRKWQAKANEKSELRDENGRPMGYTYPRTAEDVMTIFTPVASPEKKKKKSDE